VEEQFYLLWPLCVCYLSRRQLLRICVFAFFVCLAIRFFLVQHDPGPPLIERMTITRMDTLLVGAFCAIVVRDPDLLRQIRRWLPGVALFSFLGMFMIDFVAHEIRSRTHYTQSFGYSFLALGFGAFVLWGYLQNERGTALDLFLQQGWLRSFVKYSYGIYVYHLPLFIAGEYLFARKHVLPMVAFPSAAYCVGMVALSFGVARLSYALFEQRFLNMKRRFEPSLLRKPHAPDEDEDGAAAAHSTA
jgi:peptidoglycan/LPS O-acetylase OafA/YrhL